MTHPSKLAKHFLIPFLLILFSSAFAQESKPQLSLQDLFLSAKFRGDTFDGGKWNESGPVITFIENKDGATNIIKYNLETDVSETVLDGSKLLATDVDKTIAIEDYDFSDDSKKVLLYTDSAPVWRQNTQGIYYVYDFDCDCLTPLSERDKGYQMFAKFSPDGKYVAFVRNRNLFLVHTETMNETQLTDTGSEGGIINGTTDWVYEEELFLRDGWSWSPDSRHIAFYQFDETDVNEFVMADLRDLKPKLIRFKFPLAGEPNSEIRIGVIDIATGKSRFFETGTWGTENEDHEYLMRMGWTPKIDGIYRVWMLRTNREQNRVDLLYGDPKNMGVESILTEKEDSWVEVFDQSEEDRRINFIKDGEYFVWFSEIDGYKHLYLYTKEGKPVRQITKGGWKVTAFHGIDKRDRVYFTATAENPRERHLYRMPLRSGNGAAPEKITKEAGTHRIDMSNDVKYYIDTYSNINTPWVTRLHDADGKLLKVLEANEELKQTLKEYDLPKYDFIQVPGADDTQLYGYVVKPSDFDPEKKYPLLMFTYGGPWAQVVTNSWSPLFGMWHIYLAEEHDIIVAAVDNRGSAGRGKAFASALYKNMATVEPKDQIAAAKYFGTQDYIDADHIGIWGWSYGGYNTLNSMLKFDGPETFKVGVAVAPGIDWRLYDTIYTERYMSTPQKNPEGYREANPANFADQMQDDQHLLIVQGDLDDNVHLQNTVQIISALQKANKQFELMIYPGGNHGMIGTGNPSAYLHLFTMITNFLTENLN